MWTELVRYHALFDSAVLTGRDAAGYPFSVRCSPRLDAATQTLRLALPAGTAAGAGADGPALAQPRRGVVEPAEYESARHP